MTLEKDIIVPDNRTIKYVIYGSPDFTCPVFYFHGYPGSAIEAGLADAFAKEIGITIISVNRPGFGGSDPLRHRRLLDWPQDVSFIADALRINRFSILAVSGGAPYAAACGYALGSRIEKLIIVSGICSLDEGAPLDSMVVFNRTLLKIGRKFPPHCAKHRQAHRSMGAKTSAAYGVVASKYFEGCRSLDNAERTFCPPDDSECFQVIFLRSGGGL